MQKPLSRTERRLLVILNTLLIALPLALLLLLFLALQGRNATDTSLTYTLRFYPIRDEYAGNVQVGDAVLDAVGKREIGTVTAVESAPALTETYDRTQNALRRVPYPNYTSVTVTVRARARAVSGGYQIGGFLLYRGGKLHVRLPHLVATGICTDIQTEVAPQ